MKLTHFYVSVFYILDMIFIDEPSLEIRVLINPTNWVPIINRVTGKPQGYIAWDTLEKRMERTRHHIKTLTNGLNDQSKNQVTT